MITALVIIAGALFRRWWGSDPPTWAPSRGFRALQSAVGIAVLWLLCWLYGFSWQEAGIRSGLAYAFLTYTGMCIPHIWDICKMIDSLFGTPNLGRWFREYTQYAEAVAGGCVWFVAVTL